VPKGNKKVNKSQARGAGGTYGLLQILQVEFSSHGHLSPKWRQSFHKKRHLKTSEWDLETQK
jgi:hypothetical protein